MAFGTRSWTAVESMESGRLRAGLAKIRERLRPTGPNFASERAALLVEVERLHEELGHDLAERTRLWEETGIGAAPDDVEPALLADLVSRLKALKDGAPTK